MNLCCISYSSYIKPQLVALVVEIHQVVSLIVPTSNHNPRYYKDKIFKLYLL